MSRVEGTSVTTQRRGMSKGRSKGGGKRAMQQVTRRSPWRPRVFPSHAARDKACEHQASWLRTRDERHGERRGFVNHGALICAERHRERRGFVNHGALICDRCGSWRMAEASNVFELLQCGILLAYWVWDSFDTGRVRIVCYVVRMWLTCGYL